MLKIGTSKAINVTVLKLEQCWFYNSAKYPKNVNGIEHCVDPNHIAPLGVVLLGSVLFGQTYISQ